MKDWTLTEANGVYSLRHPREGGGAFTVEDQSARIAIAAMFLRDMLATQAGALQATDVDLIARGMSWADTERHMREACAQAGVQWDEEKEPQSIAINVMQRLANAAHKTGFLLGLERAALASPSESPAARPNAAGQEQEDPALIVDTVPPATSRDRWMYEQGRLAERDPRSPGTRAALIEECCALIKAADDKAMEGDYMLDSNDCISVLRGTWTPPLEAVGSSGMTADKEKS